MIDGPFAGLADVCKSPLPPTYPGYTGEFFKFSHDVAKAKALLAQAGYSKGFSATLSYRADSAVEDQMARAIQTSLGEVGVQLSLSKQASSTYLQNILTHKFPMYLYVDSSILPNPSYALNLWLNSSSAIDYSRYENAQVNKSINEMLTTLDESKGLELAKQVQELVMQDPPWIYLVNPGYHVLLSSNVDGFAWRTPINPIEYRNLTLS
jgi:peptide/nickel transport system substrate-binding protein